MLADVLVVTTGACAIGTCVEARDAAKHSRMHRISPQQRIILRQKSGVPRSGNPDRSVAVSKHSVCVGSYHLSDSFVHILCARNHTV